MAARDLKYSRFETGLNRATTGGKVVSVAMPEAGEVAAASLWLKDTLPRGGSVDGVKFEPNAVSSVGKRLVLTPNVSVSFGLHGFIFPFPNKPSGGVYAIMGPNGMPVGWLCNGRSAGAPGIRVHRDEPLNLGDDLLSMTMEVEWSVANMVCERNIQIKTQLCDQHVVAGIGKRLLEVAMVGTGIDGKEKGSELEPQDVIRVLRVIREKAEYCRKNLFQHMKERREHTESQWSQMWHTRYWV
jgi:hypothetical protein